MSGRIKINNAQCITVSAKGSLRLTREISRLSNNKIMVPALARGLTDPPKKRSHATKIPQVTSRIRV